jgi:hypothetical protein
MSISNYFDEFQYQCQVIPTLSKTCTVWVNRSTLITTIKFLDHYGNIGMMPVQFIIDVDKKRTLNNKVD